MTMTEMSWENISDHEPDGVHFQASFNREQLRGTNINADTLLATDFLNHFNEVAMLIEMLPMMPEAIDDITSWKTWTYEEHFRRSGLRDADLAIAAYHHAPEVVRITFDDAIERLNLAVIRAGSDAEDLIKSENEIMVADGLSEITLRIRMIVDEASAIINGGSVRPNDEGEAAQTAVDALFD